MKKFIESMINKYDSTYEIDLEDRNEIIDFIETFFFYMNDEEVQECEKIMNELNY